MRKRKSYSRELNEPVPSSALKSSRPVRASRWNCEYNLIFRSSGETLSKQQFEKRLAAVIAYLYPTYKPYELASDGFKGGDPLQKELAVRERPNRVGILAVSLF